MMRCPYPFNLEDEQISGTLTESFKLWQFHSNHPAFVKVCPKGVISSGILYDKIREEHRNIFNGIVEAAEAKGYTCELEE